LTTCPSVALPAQLKFQRRRGVGGQMSLRGSLPPECFYRGEAISRFPAFVEIPTVTRFTRSLGMTVIWWLKTRMFLPDSHEILCIIDSY